MNRKEILRYLRDAKPRVESASDEARSAPPGERVLLYLGLISIYEAIMDHIVDALATSCDSCDERAAIIAWLRAHAELGSASDPVRARWCADLARAIAGGEHFGFYEPSANARSSSS